MPNRPSDTDTALAPDAPAAAEYERDFYSWALEQARFVRENNLSSLDRVNVAEEIESLGRAEFAKLRGELQVLLTYMLSWDHQRDSRCRNWILSIALQRIEVSDILRDSPSLMTRIPQASAQAFRLARLAAASEMDVDEKRLPEICPYSWDEIANRNHGLS